MKLLYTDRAVTEIDEAIGYLSDRSPSGAFNVAARIREVALFLAEQPFAGAATTRKNIRRFVVNPYPYSIFYRIRENQVIIMRFRHTARR